MVNTEMELSCLLTRCEADIVNRPRANLPGRWERQKDQPQPSEIQEFAVKRERWPAYRAGTAGLAPAATRGYRNGSEGRAQPRQSLDQVVHLVHHQGFVALVRRVVVENLVEGAPDHGMSLRGLAAL